MRDDEGKSNEEPPQDAGADTDSAESKEKEDTVVHLQWRDWVALMLASLETILLPAVAIIIVLVVLIIAFRYFG